MLHFNALAEQLKEAAEDLANRKDEGGCYRFYEKEMKDTPINKNLYIVLGWASGWNDDSVKDRYLDDGYRLCVKVGYQAINNIMQCDYDIDFNEVYDKKTGETWESEIPLYEDTDFNNVAKDIFESYNYTIKNWNKCIHQ